MKINNGVPIKFTIMAKGINMITPVIHLIFCSTIPFMEIVMAYNEAISPTVIKNITKIIFFFKERLLFLVLKVLGTKLL